MKDDGHDLIASRVTHSEDAMRYCLNQILYSDGPEGLPLTGWQRLKRRMAMYCQRCADAWLVLIGKANIE